MKYFFITLLLIQSIHCQCQFDLSGEWNTKTFPDVLYDFQDSGKVEINWINDIGSYNRLGNYETKEDSIFINYDPIFSFEQVDSLTTSDTLFIMIFEPQEYPLVQFKIFRKTSSEIVEPDSNGYLTIAQPNRVDSIYFGSSGYFTNDFYQIPKEFITANYLEMKIDFHLLNYVFKSNKAVLIRINDDEIYNGINYDPDMNYIGGILTRNTKPNKK